MEQSRRGTEGGLEFKAMIPLTLNDMPLREGSLPSMGISEFQFVMPT